MTFRKRFYRISSINYPQTCCFQVPFGTFLVGPVALLFSPDGILSIDMKAFVSVTGKIRFIVYDASLYGFIKRSNSV